MEKYHTTNSTAKLHSLLLSIVVYGTVCEKIKVVPGLSSKTAFYIQDRWYVDKADKPKTLQAKCILIFCVGAKGYIPYTLQWL